MMSQNIYFIDIDIIYQIFLKNLWYLFKLLIVAYLFFYWVPIKIFPQKYTGKGIEKIVINFIYMVSYIEIVVTFLIFIKAFSILLFIFSLIFTKLLFLKFYYHKDILPIFDDLKNSIMNKLFILMDRTKEVKKSKIEYLENRLINYIKSITFYNALQNILFFPYFFISYPF